RLYTDAAAREDFLAAPRAAAARAELDSTTVDALTTLDRTGLELAARSFERKRARRTSPLPRWRRWLVASLGRGRCHSRASATQTTPASTTVAPASRGASRPSWSQSAPMNA